MKKTREIITWVVLWAILLWGLLFGLPAYAKPVVVPDPVVQYQIINKNTALVKIGDGPVEEAITSYSWFGNGFPTPKDFIVALITKDKVVVIYKDFYQIYTIEGK